MATDPEVRYDENGNVIDDGSPNANDPRWDDVSDEQKQAILVRMQQAYDEIVRIGNLATELYTDAEAIDGTKKGTWGPEFKKLQAGLTDSTAQEIGTLIGISAEYAYDANAARRDPKYKDLNVRRAAQGQVDPTLAAPDGYSIMPALNMVRKVVGTGTEKNPEVPAIGLQSAALIDNTTGRRVVVLRTAESGRSLGVPIKRMLPIVQGRTRFDANGNDKTPSRKPNESAESYANRQKQKEAEQRHAGLRGAVNALVKDDLPIVTEKAWRAALSMAIQADPSIGTELLQCELEAVEKNMKLNFNKQVSAERGVPQTYLNTSTSMSPEFLKQIGLSDHVIQQHQAQIGHYQRLNEITNQEIPVAQREEFFAAQLADPSDQRIGVYQASQKVPANKRQHFIASQMANQGPMQQALMGSTGQLLANDPSLRNSVADLASFLDANVTAAANNIATKSSEKKVYPENFIPEKSEAAYKMLSDGTEQLMRDSRNLNERRRGIKVAAASQQYKGVFAALGEVQNAFLANATNDQINDIIANFEQEPAFQKMNLSASDLTQLRQHAGTYKLLLQEMEQNGNSISVISEFTDAINQQVAQSILNQSLGARPKLSDQNSHATWNKKSKNKKTVAQVAEDSLRKKLTGRRMPNLSVRPRQVPAQRLASASIDSVGLPEDLEAQTQARHVDIGRDRDETVISQASTDSNLSEIRGIVARGLLDQQGDDPSQFKLDGSPTLTDANLSKFNQQRDRNATTAAQLKNESDEKQIELTDENELKNIHGSVTPGGPDDQRFGPNPSKMTGNSTAIQHQQSVYMAKGHHNTDASSQAAAEQLRKDMELKKDLLRREQIQKQQQREQQKQQPNRDMK